MNSFSRFAKVSIVLANFLFHKIKESYPRTTLHRANGPQLESVEKILGVWSCNVLSSTMQPMFSTLSVLSRLMYGNPNSGIRKFLLVESGNDNDWTLSRITFKTWGELSRSTTFFLVLTPEVFSTINAVHETLMIFFVILLDF